LQRPPPPPFCPMKNTRKYDTQLRTEVSTKKAIKLYFYVFSSETIDLKGIKLAMN
jgi:hypothetical protein